MSLTILLTRLNDKEGSDPEYHPETLDAMLLLFFISVPVVAVVSVLYHVS
jgi:hypothetical protein